MEALASGQYFDLDSPSGYAMFGREKGKKSGKDGNVDVVMSMMNTLCQALTPKLDTIGEKTSRIISYEKGRVT